MGNLRKLLAILCTIAIMLALSPPVSVLADGPVGGYNRDDFERIAEGGFSDEMNNYAWAMAEFNGDLYVGTGRNVPYMLLGAFGMTDFEYITEPRGELGDYDWAEDMLAEIWRYHDGEWEQVYQSEVEEPYTGFYLPSEWGFREMVVFEDAIYAAIGAGFIPGRLLLKSTDGTTWEQVKTPIAMGTDARTIAVHGNDGKLYVGLGFSPEVWASDAPSTTVDNWEEVADFSCVGPGENSAVLSLATFNGYLYAGTENIESGFQVFRSDDQLPDEPVLGDWTQIVYHGAGDMMNYWAGTMEGFDGQLYMGSMSLPIVGLPKGFELIRIDTSDDWELVIGDYVAQKPPSPDGWWDNGWQYRQKLTFDNSGREELDNFPVLVKLDSTRIDYDETETDGADIRFVDDDNETELPYEIEEWNKYGDSWVWVKVPQIDAGSTTDYIYMYYGSCDAIDDQNPEGVWNPFAMVQHMQEDPSGTAPQMMDSTDNDNDGTSGGSMTSLDQVQGQIDGSLDFDGTDDYIDCGDIDSGVFDGVNDKLTTEAWIYVDTAIDPYRMVISKYNTEVSPNHVTFYINVVGQKLRALASEDGDSAGDIYFTTNDDVISTTTWYYIVAVIDLATENIDLYVDGVEKASTKTTSGTPPTVFEDNDTPVDIGDHTDNGGAGRTGFWDGIIDEVRISDTARSADWINAQYASMMDSFINYGEMPVYQPRLPISGWPGGFGNFMNFYCWSLQEHEGVLYLGTFDASSFLPFVPEEFFELFPELTPEQLEVIVTSLEEALDLLEGLEMDEYYIEAFERLLEAFDVGAPEDIDWEEVWQVFIDYFAGADLWKTEDGIFWWPVTLNGFGNPDNYGVRNMIAVNPLFAGMANPFNGLEIWQAPLPPPYVGGVGGEVYPINKLGILAPWIALAMLLIGSIACLTLRRRRAQS